MSRRPRFLHWALLAALPLLSGCWYVGAAAAGAILSLGKNGGGTVVLTAQNADLLVSAITSGAVNLPSTEAKGFVLPALHLQLSATATTTVEAITVSSSGTGDESAIGQVQLFQDLDEDGVVGASDPQLGATEVFSADDGAVTFTGLGLTLAASQRTVLLVVIETPTGAAEGDTFQLSLADADAITATTVVGPGDVRPVPVFGTPLLGAVKTVSLTGSLQILLGPASPGGTAALPNAQDVAVVQLDLRASSAEDLRLTALQFTTAGSGDDAVDVASADLYLDADSDGALDLAIDSPIALGAVPAADDGALTFAGLSEVLAAGSITRWLVVYDLSGTSADASNLRVDLVQASDVTLQGISSAQAIAPSGLPLSGATVTVTRAQLDVALGPFNPARTALPTASLVPVLQLSLSAGAAEACVVSELVIRGAGPGDESVDISGARLIVDLDGDGAVDFGEPTLAGPLTYGSDDGQLTLSGFARQIAAGSSETWLVAYDIAATATGGDAFSVTLDGPPSAGGLSSGLPVAGALPSAGGGTLSIRGSVTLSAGANHSPIADPTPLVNGGSVALAQLRLTAGLGEPVRLSSVVVTPSGSGDEPADVTAVELYHDVDGGGTWDAGDVLLQVGVFTADDGPIALSAPNLITIPAGAARDLLVVYHFSGAAAHGDTFAVRVDAIGVTATGTGSGLSLPVTGLASLVGDTLTAQRGQLTAAVGPAPAIAQDVLDQTPAGVDIVVLQALLTAGPAETVRVNSLQFQASGSVTPTTGITSIQAYRDVNVDGAIDGGDVLLGSAASFGGGGDVTFPVTGSLDIAASGAAAVLLAVDFGGSAADGQTFACDLTAVGAAGQTTGLAVSPGGLAVAGPTQTVLAVGALNVATGPLNPAGRTVYQSQTVAVQQLVLSASGETVSVGTLTVRGAGTGADDTGISAITLYVDVNQNGLVDVGDGLPIASAPGGFAADPGVLSLAPALNVAPGAPTPLLVAYTFTAAPTDGDTFGAAAIGPADVGATGVDTGAAVSPTGTAAAGGLMTYGTPGSLAVTDGPATPIPGRTVYAGESVALQQVSLTAANEDVRVDTYTVRGLGTGDDATGLTQVAIYRDDNGNGVLDSDTLLTTGAYASDPGALTLSPAGGLLVVSPGPAVHLLIVYRFDPAAVLNDTFAVAPVTAAADLTATGVFSGLSINPTGSALSGGTMTVGSAGDLTISDGASPPAPATVDAHQAVAVQQVHFAAATEAVRVDSYTLTTTGSGDDATGVAQVALYLDTNGNGALDADTLVAAGTLAVDDGSLVFSASGGLFTVPAAGGLDLLVALRLSSAPNNGDTFGIAALSGADVTATGVASGGSITPTGGAGAGAVMSFGTAVDASASTVALAPASAVADGADATTVTVTLVDAIGAPLAGLGVSFAASGGGNVWGAASGTTDAAGVVTGTLASTVAEAKQVTATADPAGAAVVLDDRPTVTFTPGPVSVATSTVDVSPAAVTADGVAAATVTVVARDALGNPIPAAPVVLAASGTGGTLGLPPATDGAGASSATFVSTVAEPKVVTATVAGTALTDTGTTEFVPGAVSASTSTVTIAGSPAIADGVDLVTVTVTVRDGQGNPVPGATVTLAASGTLNLIGQPTAVTGPAGLATGTLAATFAEAKTITATAGGLVLSQRPTATFGPGPVDPALSTIELIPVSGLLADGVATATVIVTARDGQGNPISGATATFAASGGGNTLTQPAAATDEDGEATGGLAATVPEVKTVTGTVDAGAGGVALTSFGTIELVAPVSGPGVSAGLSTVTAAPGSALADGTQTTTVTVTVRDGGGSPLAGKPVSLTVTGTGNILGALASTDAGGVTTGTLASTVAEAKLVTAVVDPGVGQVVLSQQPPVTFTAGSIDAGTSTITLAPASVTADGVALATATVRVADANDNPVAGATVSLAVSGTLNLQGALAPTGADGTTTGTLASTWAELKTVNGTATLGGDVVALTDTGTVTFVPGAVSAANSTVVAGSLTLTADGVEATPITITVLDAQGNPIAGLPVALAASGTLNLLSQPVGATDAAGVIVGTLASTRAEAKTVTATVDPGLAEAVLSQQAAVTFVPGPVDPALSTLAIAPSTGLIADGAATATVEVTVRDAQGNPISGGTVALVATGSGNTLSQPPAAGADGVAAGGLATTTAEIKTVSATVDAGLGPVALAASGTVEFVSPAAVAVSAGNSSVTRAPATVTADGTATTLITITVLDGSSGPVAGLPVSVTASGSNNTLGSFPATDAAGVTTGTLASTRAEAKTITVVVDPGLNQVVLSNQPVVTFTAGSIDAGSSLIDVTPADVTADGAATAQVTVTVADAFGNPVSGATVTLASSGTGNTLTGPGAATDAAGQTTATLASTGAGLKTITGTAQLGGDVIALTDTGTVTFSAGAVSDADSTVAVAPGALVADGAAAATVTVTLADVNGNPVPGVDVLLGASGTGNTIAQPAAVTDAFGVAVGTLATTVAEAKTVTAIVEPGPSQLVLTQQPVVTFTVGSIDASASTIDVAPVSLPADGASPATVTVTVLDALGNPISGATVTLAASGAGNTLVGPGAVTDTSGQATATLTSAGAGLKTITGTAALGADVAALLDTGTVTFTPDDVSAGTSTVTVAPPAVVADGLASATVTVTLLDASGNPVSGGTVALAVSGTGNLLTQPGLTDAAGVTTGTLASTVAEAKTITATYDPGTNQVVLSQQPGVTFTAGSIDAGTSTITLAPASVTADGVALATATVRVADANDNPVAGATVTLAVSGTLNLLGSLAPTGADGATTGTLASTWAELKTVTGTAALAGDVVPLTDTGSVTFVPGAVSAAASTVAAGSLTLTADGVEATPITVTVLDAQGNPIAGLPVTLAASGTLNLLSQPVGVTDAAGVIVGTLASTRAEAKTVAATVDPGPSEAVLSQQATVTFVPGPVDPALSTLAITPATGLVADGAATATVEVTARDAQGNPVAGGTVALAATGSGNTLSQPPATTDASGAATGGLATTTAEIKTVSATVDAGLGPVALAASGTVEFVSPAANGVSAGNSTVTLAPAAVTADGVALTVVTVTVRDTTNAALAGRAVSLSASGSGNVFGTLAATDGAGVTTGTLASTVAEAKTVTATVDPGTNQVVLSLHPGVTFTAGSIDAGTSTITLAPASVTADGVALATATVRVADANDNPVAGATVTLAVSGTLNLLGSLAPTGADGTTTGTLASTWAELKTVTGTASLAGDVVPLTDTGSVTFVPGAVSAAASTVAAGSLTLTADGVEATPITVTVLDAQGNPIAGLPVTLAASGTLNLLSQPVGVTDAAGVLVGTLASTRAEAKTVTATVDPGPSEAVLSQQATVTFVPGPVDPARSLLAVAPTAGVTADGVAQATIRVVARDAQDNPIAGGTITLAATGTGNLLSLPLDPTDADGTALGYLTSTTAEAKTVNGSVDVGAGAVGLTPAGAQFLPGPASSATSTVVAAPGAVLADGVAAATVTVTVTDAQGNPVSGGTVTLTTTGTGSLLTQPGLTDGAGVAVGTLASTVAEGKTLTATVEDGDGTVLLAMQPTVLFTTGSIDALASSLVVTPAAVDADGVDTARITVTVVDAQANPVAGATVILAVSGSSNTLGPLALTDAAGVTTGTLSSTWAELKTINGTAALGGDVVGLLDVGTVDFQPGPIDSAGSSVLAIPGVVTADGLATTTVLVTVVDAVGNAISGGTVTLTSTGTANLFVQPAAPTDAAGVATGTLASTLAETKVLTATVFDGTSLVVLSQRPTVQFTAGSLDAGSSTLTVSPSTVLADGAASASVLATVRDANGNPVAGATVTLAASGTGNLLTQPGGVTDAAGLAVGTLAATGGGVKTVTGTATLGGDSVALAPDAVTFLTVGTLSLATGGANPGPANVFPGDARGVQQVRLTAGGEDVRLTSLTASCAGSAPPSGVSDVRLYLDANGDGALDTGDTFLTAGGPFGAVPGTLALAPAGGIVTVSPGSPVDLLLVYALAAGPSPGDTIAAGTLLASDLVAEGVGSGASIPAAGSAAAGGTLTFGVSGTLAVATGAANPGADTVYPDQTRTIQQVRLTAANEDVRLDSYTLTTGGDLPATAVGSLALYVDGDADGTLGLADTFLTAASLTANPGTLAFAPAGGIVTISPGSPLDLIVVARFRTGGAAGQTFQALALGTADLAATGLSTGASTLVSGGAVAGGTLTHGVVGGLVLSTGPGNPAAATVYEGESRAVQQLLLSAADEDVVVTRLVVTSSGDAPAGAVTTVSLHTDLDGDGVLDVGDPLLASATTPSWWDAAWSYRMRLGAYAPGSSENLRNFPVLVRLTPARFDYSKVQPNGEDLRFVALDDETLLDFDIDVWNPAGESLIWVRLPTLHGASTAEAFYLYFGNGAASAGANPTGVWSADYDAVYHLETNVGGVLDASGAGRDGVAQSGVADATARLSGGQSFDGIDDYVALGTLGLLRNAPAATLSAWVNVAAGGMPGKSGQNYLASFFHSIAPGGSPTLDRASLAVVGDVGDGSFSVWARAADGDTTANAYAPAAYPAEGTWFWVTGVVDYAAEFLEVYVDGQLVAADSASYSLTTTSNTDPAAASLGAYPDGSAGFTAATLDEARTARVARSPGWIAAQYLSQTDSLLTYGSLEVPGLTPFGTNPGAVVLSDASGLLTVAPGSPAKLLVVFSYGAGAAPGETFSAAGVVAPSGLTAEGATSGSTVAASGNAAAGGAMTFGANGALTVSTGPANPGADTVADGDLEAVQQVTFDATGEDVRVTRVTVASAGDAPAAAVTSVRLYDDVGGDGVIDIGDTLLASQTTPVWWNTSWTRRIRLGLETANLSESLTDVPVLVRLDTARFDYGNAQANGADLRFVASDDQTVLDHEIDVWNPAGESLIWVRLPHLGGGTTGQALYLYYGNGGAANAQNAPGVWSGYQAVYHLEDSTGGVLMDSSGNGRDGVNAGASNIAGAVGGGQDFDGVADTVSLGTLGLLRDVPGFTIEAWIRPDTIPATSPTDLAVAVSTGTLASGVRAGLGVWEANDGQTVGRANDDELPEETSGLGTRVSAGNFHHLVGVVNFAGDLLLLYRNGELVEADPDNFTGTRSANTDPLAAAIGSAPDGSADFFDGIVDEVRIAGVVRSPGWVAAQYASTTDALLSYGTVELQGGTTPFTTNPGQVVFQDGSGLFTVTDGVSRHLLVVFAYGPGATTGETFSAAGLAGASAVTAEGIGSGVAITPSGTAAAGGTMTFGAAPTLAVSQVALGAAVAAPDAADLPMLHMRLTEGTGNDGVRLDTLTLTGGGTGDESSDVVVLELWVDANGDGAVTFGDTRIGVSAYFADDGAATFAGLSGTVVPAGGTLDLLVTYDMGDNSVVGNPAGEDYAVSLLAGDLVVESATGAAPVTPTGLPITGPTRTAGAATTPALTASQPAGLGTTVDAGDADVGMLWLRLTETTSNGTVKLTSLAVTASGSGEDATEVSFVELWRDVDRNGLRSGPDVQVGLTAYFLDDGVATFGGLSELVGPGGSLDLLVTYDMASTVTGSVSFTATAAAGGITAVADASGDPVAVSGLPLTGTTRSTSPPLDHFNAPVTIVYDASGTTLVDLVAGDVDRDGAVDAVLLLDDGGATQLAVLLGDGAGGFTVGGTYAHAADTNPNGLAIGDVDLDGFPDVVTVTPTKFVLYANDRTGGFGTQTSVRNVTAMLDVVLADCDRDGDLDAVGRDGGLDRYYFVPVAGGVFSGTGNARSTFYAPLDHLVFDVNRDGTLDLVAKTGNGGVASNELAVYYWDGQGTDYFQFASADLLDNADGGGGIVTADFDRDGFPDVVHVAEPDLRTFSSDGATTAGFGLLATMAANAGLTPTGASAVVTGDWDGDGFMDLGVLHNGTDGLVVHVGASGFAFPAGNAASYDAGTDPDRVAAADFDRDGDLDLLVGSTAVSGSLVLLLGDGVTGGGVQDAAGVGVGAPTNEDWIGPAIPPQGVVIDDVNRDGNPDFVLGSDALAVWLGAGDGGFTKQADQAVASPVDSLAVADMNQDGIPDLVMSFWNGVANDNIGVWLGDGAGGFTAAGTIDLGSGARPDKIALGDLDHDGDLDVVTADIDKNWITPYAGDGNGSLTLGTSLTTGVPSVDVALGDWYGSSGVDGSLDAIVASTGSLTLGIGDGAGGFTLGASVSVDPSVGTINALAIGDIDRDGRLDAVVVGTDGVVEIFQGTSSGVTPFTSVGTLALAQQMKDVVLADMDKDGDLDLVASTPDPTDRGLYIVPNTNPSAFQFDTGAVQKQAGPPIDALAVGDVNKDGDPDVVAVGVPGGIYNQGGRVYLGR